MKIENKTVRELIKEYQLKLDPAIQRCFEWEESKVKSACIKIYETAKEFYNDRRGADCRRRFGTIECYEIPREDGQIVKMYGYFIDDGGHRTIFCFLTIKVLLDIIEENKNEITADSHLVDEDTLAMMKTCVKNIRTNFQPTESDEKTFATIMSDDFVNYEPTKAFKKQALNSAYYCIKEFFTQVMEDDYEEFGLVCEHIIENITFNVQFFEPTSVAYRLENYNEINNISQEQTELHRAISSLSELASRNNIDNFKEIVDGYMAHADNRGLSSVDAVMMKYLRMKMISYFGLKALPSSGKLYDMIINTLNEDNGAQFFKTLFDEFKFFCELRRNNVTCRIPHSKQNSVVRFLVASLCEALSSSNLPREISGTFYLQALTKLFVIEQDCVISGLKEGVDVHGVIKMLKYITIYKFCLNTYVFSQGTSDERNAFKPILQEPVVFNDDNIELYTSRFKFLSDICRESPTYNSIGVNGCTHKNKGCAFATCLISNTGKTMEEHMEEAATCYFNLDRYDLDHIFPKKYEKINALYNLRLLKKGVNRSQSTDVCFVDKYGRQGRFIENDDITMPEELRGRFLTKEDLVIRRQWVTDILHKCLDFLYEY
jgi:hypothetical protein